MNSAFNKLLEKRKEWSARLDESQKMRIEAVSKAEEACLERDNYILKQLKKVNDEIKEICPHTDTREKFLDYWRNNTIYKRYCNVCNKVIGQLTINDKEWTEEYEEL